MDTIDSNSKKQLLITILICAGLAAIIITAFEPLRHNGFIEFYDDNSYVTKNPNVLNGLTANSIAWSFSNTTQVNWHPLTWISHMLDCDLYRLNPAGHHLTSIILHILNTFLLFFILRKIINSTWLAAFAAAVFAIHPLQVDSVAWIAERKTVLSGLFFLLTIYTYFRFTEKQNALRYILLIFVYFLSIMTKPVVVTLPLILLLLDFWPLGRLQNLKSSIKLLVEKIPLFILSAILCFITFITQKRAGAVISIEDMPLDYRVANSFVSYIRYLSKTIWPGRLAPFYPANPADLSPALATTCILMFLALTFFCIYEGRRKRYLITGWLWFVITLIPTIGLVQAGGQSMANRYMYLPIIGLLIIFAGSIKDLTSSMGNRIKFLSLPAAAILICAIAVTRVQTGYWQNSITLFEHTLKVTQNNSLAELCYGCALGEAGNFDNALMHIQNAIRISPKFFEAREKLGILYMKMGKYNEAVDCFNKLLPLNKNTNELHYNLASIYLRQKKYDDALNHLNIIFATAPNYFDTRQQIYVCILAQGRTNDAISFLNQALTKCRDKAGVYSDLGTVYIVAGKIDMAIESWTKSIQLKPDNVNALNNLAWLLATSQKTKMHNPALALVYAKNACQITNYKRADSLDTLAAALAANGQFPDAIITAEKALNAAKASNQTSLAKDIAARLELYRANKPYLEK